MPKQKRQQERWRYRIRDAILPNNYYTPVDTFCQEERLKKIGGWAEAKSRKKSQKPQPLTPKAAAPARKLHEGGALHDGIDLWYISIVGR
jgi:hypothetical protein